MSASEHWSFCAGGTVEDCFECHGEGVVCACDDVGHVDDGISCAWPATCPCCDGVGSFLCPGCAAEA